MIRILIVDDSPTILIALEMVLTDAGYAVEKASSAEAALELLDTGVKPNLVITDLNMGGMNGIELIRTLRQRPASRFTPIVMLTTESADDRRAEAKESGATGWIVKPFKPNTLLAVVRQVVPGA